EIPLEQARTELSGFQRELVTAYQTLALHLGRPDLSEATVSGALAEAASPGLPDQGPQQWLPSHPSGGAVRGSRAQAEVARGGARLEPYPDVRMGVSGGRIGETGQSIIQLG